MRSLSKAPKQRRIEDTRFENDQMVFNPSEILEEKQREWEKKNPERFAQQPDHEVFMKPEFYEEALEKTRERKALKKEKERQANKPEQPLQGPYGKAGKFFSGGTYAQYIMKSTIKNTMRDQDPREALLARADDAEQNPLFVGKAYQ